MMAGDWRDRRVLVTGASSGIGRALALAFAERGCQLLLTARRADRLDTLQAECGRRSPNVWTVAGDITDERTRQELRDTAAREWQGLDVLVNNAGVGARGPFRMATADRLRRVMEVNFFAPVELTRLLLPLLAAGRSPTVVNIGSVLGHRAVPDKSEYCASKFALHGFSDALRAELAGQRIHVLLVSPSTTDSEFTANLLDNQAEKKSWGRPMSAEQVARHTVRGIERQRHELILSWGGKWLVWLDRLTPTLADWLVARYG